MPGLPPRAATHEAKLKLSVQTQGRTQKGSRGLPRAEGANHDPGICTNIRWVLAPFLAQSSRNRWNSLPNRKGIFCYVNGTTCEKPRSPKDGGDYQRCLLQRVQTQPDP